MRLFSYMQFNIYYRRFEVVLYIHTFIPMFGNLYVYTHTYLFMRMYVCYFNFIQIQLELHVCSTKHTQTYTDIHMFQYSIHIILRMYHFIFVIYSQIRRPATRRNGNRCRRYNCCGVDT